MPTDYDHKLARLAYRRGYASQDALQDCGRRLVRMEKSGAGCDLADVLLERGLVTPEQIVEMDRDLALAGVEVPGAHRFVVRQREEAASRMSRVEMGEIPEEAFGAPPVCTRCGALLAEELIAADAKGAPRRLCARCRAECAQEGQVFQGYRVEEQLGEGRIGIVYLARDLNLRRDVALKICPERVFDLPYGLNGFMNALNAALRISHPRLVPVFACGRWGRSCYFVTERVKAPTLRSLMDEAAGLRPKERPARLAPALENAIEAAAALHSIGLEHGELRPRKIFVAEGGEARLADWTLPARKFCKVGPGEADAYYEPPVEDAERVLGGPRRDVVALARIAVEALFGRRVEGPLREEDIRPGWPRAVAAFARHTLGPDPAKWPDAIPTLRREVGRLRSLA